MTEAIGYEDYTDDARQVLKSAEWDACMCGSTHIAPEHVLLGAVRLGPPPFAPFGMQIDLGTVRRDVERQIPMDGPRSRDLFNTAVIPFDAAVKRVLRLASQLALASGLAHLDSEHLIAALVLVPETLAATVLQRNGLTPSVVRDRFPNGGDH